MIGCNVLLNCEQLLNMPSDGTKQIVIYFLLEKYIKYASIYLKTKKKMHCFFVKPKFFLEIATILEE